MFKDIFGAKTAKKNNRDPIAFNSVFRRYIIETDPDAPYYEERRIAAGLCDDALRVAGRRLEMSKVLHTLEEKLIELKGSIKLTDEESLELTRLLDRFLNLSNERAGLYEQLTSFDKSMYEMTQMEDEAHEAAATLQDAEGYQSMLRHDIGRLQGEKSNLEYEQRLLVRAMNFVVKFAYFLGFLFVCAIVTLSYFALTLGANIFFPSVGIFLMLISLVAVMYGFRRRAAFELNVNQRRQSRAVELLNRKNVLFAYYTNFTKYCYGKYKVRNSKMLATNLSELDNYKKVVAKLNNVGDAMRKARIEIEEKLMAHGIKNDRATLESFAKNANFERDRIAAMALEKKVKEAESALVSLDAKQEELWNKVCSLMKKSPGREGVQPIIQTYLDEVDKLIEKETSLNKKRT
jgi:hypothetical protein